MTGLSRKSCEVVIIYLAGDSVSYAQATDHLESVFARKLATCWGLHFISQRDLHNSRHYVTDQEGRSVTERVQGLHDCINALGMPTIVVGRSSGARVASICTQNPHVVAAICFAYPFKHPNQPDEPARYEHLRTTDKPILIVQGYRDEYGGISAVPRYGLSETVDLFYVRADHQFKLPEQTLELIRKRINRFLIQSNVLPSSTCV